MFGIKNLKKGGLFQKKTEVPAPTKKGDPIRKVSVRRPRVSADGRKYATEKERQELRSLKHKLSQTTLDGTEHDRKNYLETLEHDL